MSAIPKRTWSDIMTVDQVAAYLQLNRLTIYRYIREGRLPASKVGKAYRIRKADVEWFLDSARTRPVRRPKPAVQPEAVAARRPEPVVVTSRPDSTDLRDRELALTPMEWVSRGLH